MAAPTPERIVIADVEPAEFANETCSHFLHVAETALAGLQEVATLKVQRGSLAASTLWRQAHAWATYARTGQAAHAELLQGELKPYDEISELVCSAVQGRLALAKAQPVNVAQLGAIAGLSKIHVGNLVREARLPVVPDVSPYTVRAAVARDFLRSRSVLGFT